MSMVNAVGQRLAAICPGTEAPTVTWQKDELRYCVAAFEPNCTKHYVRRRTIGTGASQREFAIFKTRDVDRDFVPFTAAPAFAAASDSKTELDWKCAGNSTLAYSLKVELDPAQALALNWSDADALNSLLSAPLYPLGAPVQFDRQFVRLGYEWKVPSTCVAGADAEMNVEVDYASYEQRASGVAANLVDVQLRLEGDVALGSLRTGQGLLAAAMEAFDRNSASHESQTAGEVVAITVGCMCAVLLFVAAVVWVAQGSSGAAADSEHAECAGGVAAGPSAAAESRRAQASEI